MIELKNIQKRYGNFIALDGVTFTIEKGKITALLGPNGAGKTTSMKIITGFLEASSGQVVIDGEVLTEKTREHLQSSIGYLPENAPLYPELNVWEHLDFSAKIHGIPESEREKHIRSVAKSCGLSEKLYFDISELSKGYKQRVGLAQAIIHDPDILILDEPTTGLDPNQILEIRELIASWKEDKTILLSTHIMQEVEAMADNVVVINNGQVIEESEKSKLSFGSNEAQFHIAIEIDGKASDITKAKKSIETIKEVTQVEKTDHILLLHAESDCRAEVARKVVQAKLDLIGLSLQKASLEDIFRHLTQQQK